MPFEVDTGQSNVGKDLSFWSGPSEFFARVFRSKYHLVQMHLNLPQSGDQKGVERTYRMMLYTWTASQKMQHRPFQTLNHV